MRLQGLEARRADGLFCSRQDCMCRFTTRVCSPTSRCVSDFCGAGRRAGIRSVRPNKCRADQRVADRSFAGEEPQKMLLGLNRPSRTSTCECSSRVEPGLTSLRGLCDVL